MSSRNTRKQLNKRKEEHGEATRKRRKVSEESYLSPCDDCEEIIVSEESHLYADNDFGLEIEDLFIDSTMNHDDREFTFRQTLGNEQTLASTAIKRKRGRPSKRKPGELNPEKFNRFWLKAFRKYALRNLPARQFPATERQFWKWLYTKKGIPETGYQYKSYSLKYTNELFSNESYHREFRKFFEKFCNTTLFSREYLRRDLDKLNKYKEHGYTELYCYNRPQDNSVDLYSCMDNDLVEIQPLSPVINYEEIEEIDLGIYDRTEDRGDFLIWEEDGNIYEDKEQNALEGNLCADEEHCLLWNREEDFFGDKEQVRDEDSFIFEEEDW